MKDGDGLLGGRSVEPETANSLGRRAPILIADDYPANLMAFREILNDARYELTLASSGQEALRLVENTEYAAILLDFRMPELNGFQTAKLMRQLPTNKLTPIIFLTAFDAPADEIAQAYAVGMDFIQKPVNDVILRSKVAFFVDLYFRRQGIISSLEATAAALEQANTQLRLQLDRCTCGCAISPPVGSGSGIA